MNRWARSLHLYLKPGELSQSDFCQTSWKDLDQQFVLIAVLDYSHTVKFEVGVTATFPSYFSKSGHFNLAWDFETEKCIDHWS